MSTQWLEIGGELINLDHIARITLNIDQGAIDLCHKTGYISRIKCTDNRVAGRLYPLIGAAIQANEERVISVMLIIIGIKQEIAALEDVCKSDPL